MSDENPPKANSDAAKGPPAAEAAKEPVKPPPPAPKKKPAPRVVEIAPMATPARMRRRHWGLMFSFIVIVVAPLVLVGWYLFSVAKDQYASTVGFTVRQEDGNGASDLLGGFAAQISGSSVQSDTDILYEFIQSQGMVAGIDDQIDLGGVYSTYWPEDRVFSIWPDPSIEELLWYWGRIVRISYEQSSGLLEIRVLAFEPETAQNIAQAILDQSQRLINELNATARADSMKFAQLDLDEAEARVRNSQAALTEFRISTQIIDPLTDLEGRLGVVNNLQQQLAQALIDLDLLSERTNSTDPRITQAERTVDVIRRRIAQERQNFASGEGNIDGKDYPTLLAEYERLNVDHAFAAQGHAAARISLDLARANASRQSRYLAAYVAPTFPETAEYPRRITLMALTALFLLLTWSILALVYYSMRDSR